MNPTPPLPFTGERFTPECVREMWLEHYARYAFAREFCAGQRVLDCACGEGFGAALLAPVAAEVTAVDLSGAAIAHAQARYPHPRLRFVQGNALQLPFADASFDRIVSFETLEHLVEHEALLAEFDRVLAPEGILLISTPDKRVYSDQAGYRNEFHPRELYADEFAALLASRFTASEVYGQRLLFQSAIQSQVPPTTALRALTHTMTETGIQPGVGVDAMYLIAACARRSELLAPWRNLSHWFGDAAQSVYQHYNDEIRKGIRAGHRIMELEAEVERLQALLAGLPPPGA